jgi:DNA-binding transcriptional MerR regulator
MSEQGLRTGELAERAGVNVQTLRYYERRGLLAAPTRRPSGQRRYPEDAVGLLRTIKAAQRLGFTLAEIEELLDLSQHRRGTGELHRRAEAKIAEIDARIGQLRQMRQSLLAVLAADCDSLTDCSCGLGSPLPVLGRAGPDQAAAEPDRRRVASSSSPPTASSPAAAPADSPGWEPV